MLGRPGDDDAKVPVVVVFLPNRRGAGGREEGDLLLVGRHLSSFLPALPDGIEFQKTWVAGPVVKIRFASLIVRLGELV